jgi:putative ABC transport system permease protein
MISQDVRYALRVLAQSPGYVLMAVLTLALGIGANSLTFSFINAYLLRPLPAVKDAGRIVLLQTVRRGEQASASYLDFLDWRSQSHSFGATTALEYAQPVLSGRGEPERISGVRVSDGFFQVYTVSPALGRGFLASETVPGGEPVVMLSDGFWQRQFGGQPGALRQSLILDGVSYKIVGILPRGFNFTWQDTDFYAPLTVETAKTPRGRRNLDVMARLKPASSMASAQAEMDVIAHRLEMAYPETNANIRVSVESMLQVLGEGPRESLQILAGIVLFVLLIACANVANLQLARATGRAGEVAIRIALGAGRWRIVRQMLIESLLVAGAGGVLGFVFSVAGARALLAAVPADYRPINNDFIDGSVLAFTALVVLAAGVASGVAPALQSLRVGINETLKEGGRGGGGAARGWMRNILVVTEVSLSVVLLLAAGLLVRGFNRLQRNDPGFRVQGLLTANVWLPDTKYPTPAARADFFERLVEHVGGLPGVESAAASTGMPFIGGGQWWSSLIVEGRPAPVAGHEVWALDRSTTPGYLRTVGIPLRRGRYFNEQDSETAVRVAIVNERLAERLFPGADPIGKQIKFGRAESKDPWMTIVGVAGNVKAWSPADRPNPEIFSPLRQTAPAASWLMVRTKADDPTAIASAVRGELRKLDRDQPITAIRSAERLVADSRAISKYMTLLIGIFGATAMLMAAMGIYGVISYAVARRTHELGIRMALGAGAPSVIRLVVKDGLRVILIGIAIGVPGAAGMTAFLRAFLYGVAPRDPLTFVLVPLGLALVGLAASLVPARRATRVDPMVALRCP